ncbi:MAG TPA: hypothetical protein VII06_30830 [Chloroflexota bacterium]|jgi:hypothetical protein
MASAAPPTDAEIGGFLSKLDEFRKTLDEKDQGLLDAMVVAAAGKKEQGGDLKPFWYAYNPPGPAGGPGYGYAAGGPYGGYAVTGYGYGGYAAGWAATPWGGAYGYRYY